MLVLKALEYDVERIKLATTDENVRAEIEKEFSPYLSGWVFDTWYAMRPEGDHASINFFYLSGPIESKFGYSFDQELDKLIFHILRSKISIEEQYNYLKNKMASDAGMLSKFAWESIGTNFNFESLLDAIRLSLKNRIAQVMRPFQQRYQRLLTVFDTPSKVQFSESDRQLICFPFPILIASTRSRGARKNLNEYQILKAKLGVDIDLIFVREEHVEPMQAWLKQHGFEKSVSVHAYSALPLNQYPLYHSPYQVLSNNKSFLNQSDQKEVNTNLNQYVFPHMQQPIQVARHASIMAWLTRRGQLFLPVP